MKKYLKLIGYFTFILIFTFMPLKLMAYENNQFYSSNDILFYDPDDCTTLPTSSSDADVVTNTANLEYILKYLTGKGLSLAAAAGIAGNIKNESGFNPAKIQGGAIANSNYTPVNGVGFGLAQWTYSNRQKPLVEFASKENKSITDLGMQVNHIWNTMPDYSDMLRRLNAIKSDTKIGLADAPVAAAIIFHGKTPKITGNPIIQSINPPSGYESSSDTATMVLRRGESAQTIYNQYKGQIKDGAGVSGVLAPDTSANSSECLGGDDDGAVSSNIVATALNYALKTPATNTMNQKSDATLAYQIGKERYNPSGAWADCGVFVATVMIASGVDVNYPKAGVVNQISYVRNHPELYKIIENPQPSDLQAGDILIAYGSGAHHTSIYTGESPYSSVDSSQDTRVPSVRNSSSVAWMLSSGAIIARVIK